ncbi:GNAT family N-acetyltransferase [Nocardioides mesophilus]|uniref:GNAT family N-acetyltransferase n=1 Tax=Nocardioides mesophilus TaxID=433659 RepID=A0A7G9R770_9ACTN|nr:GNAT family N-acetyltransferase [Nocardioides mesophilus]QNN51445.1 GNAT family N-acetyltransferase [Nocardioides mesophilus]
MDVREIDGADPELARRYWELGRASELAYRVFDSYWPWQTAEVSLREGRAGWETHLLGAFDGDRLAGVGMLTLPLLDNPHLAYLNVNVDPAWQRQGYGSALASQVEELARERGRRVMACDAYAPPGEETAGLRFLLAHGYTVGLEDAMKVVELDATEPGWAALEAEVAPRTAGYTFVTWADVVPQELLEDYCRLQEAFFELAPLGEMEIEPEVWDERRVREREESNRNQGRQEVCTAVLAADGSMVGLTEVALNRHAPHRGFQSGTLVLPEHRGHALGLAVKLRNHRELRSRFPQCRILVTGNAGINLAMNAVNDRLGYRLVERCLELQKDL